MALNLLPWNLWATLNIVGDFHIGFYGMVFTWPLAILKNGMVKSAPDNSGAMLIVMGVLVVGFVSWVLTGGYASLGMPRAPVVLTSGDNLLVTLFSSATSNGKIVIQIMHDLASGTC